MASSTGSPAGTPAPPPPPLAASATYAGCKHYRRKCVKLAPCCNTWWPCRLCHDEVHDEGERDVKKAHKFDRYAVRAVACMQCGTVQAPQQTCSSCRTQLGAYFCGTCKFFDDDVGKGLWHCDGCGLCRVGGRDLFFHCTGCSTCLRLEMRESHKCAAGMAHANCPVCMEYLPTSRRPPTQLRCGHYMHGDCLAQHVRSGSGKCPLCQASLADRGREWLAMDLERIAVAMPAEFAGVRHRVLCNDCHAESDAEFHVVGLKCAVAGCGSYNTRRVGAAASDADGGAGAGPEGNHGAGDVPAAPGPGASAAVAASSEAQPATAIDDLLHAVARVAAAGRPLSEDQVRQMQAAMLAGNESAHGLMMVLLARAHLDGSELVTSDEEPSEEGSSQVGDNEEHDGGSSEGDNGDSADDAASGTGDEVVDGAN